jgi:hypothetical protein
VAAGQTAILQNTGQEPTSWTLGYPVYQALRKHPLVIDRIKYTMQADAKAITPELLAAAFDVDRVVVAKSTYNTSNEGLRRGPTASRSARSRCSAMPRRSRASWSRRLATSSDGPASRATTPMASRPGPSRFRTAASPGSTVRCEAEMAFDMKVVGSDLGYFFTSIVA